MKGIATGVLALVGLASGFGQTGTGGQGPITPLTQTASISGTVKSSATNGPLAGNTVTAYRTAPQTPVYRSQTTTAADGSFTVASLPAGTYRICVDGTKDVHLDPCTWAANPTTVTVTDGQHAAGNVVPLAKGTTLTVQVNDPQKFLQARTGDPGPGHIFLALLPPKSAPIPIPLVQSDATTMKQQIVIPPDTSFQVLVYSKEVSLMDPTQRAVADTGGAFTVSIPSAAAQSAPIVLQVTGRKP
jgi:hypothetical protein